LVPKICGLVWHIQKSSDCPENKKKLTASARHHHTATSQKLRQEPGNGKKKELQ
jgi:hypothetical protein